MTGRDVFATVEWYAVTRIPYDSFTHGERDLCLEVKKSMDSPERFYNTLLFLKKGLEELHSDLPYVLGQLNAVNILLEGYNESLQ